jgi:hypothetical protein
MATRSKPRSGERFRDEKRAGGARYHGRSWHEHREPRELAPDLRELDALEEAESGGERFGMQKARSVEHRAAGAPRSTRAEGGRRTTLSARRRKR